MTSRPGLPGVEGVSRNSDAKTRMGWGKLGCAGPSRLARVLRGPENSRKQQLFVEILPMDPDLDLAVWQAWKPPGGLGLSWLGSKGSRAVSHGGWPSPADMGSLGRTSHLAFHP